MPTKQHCHTIDNPRFPLSWRATGKSPELCLLNNRRLLSTRRYAIPQLNRNFSPVDIFSVNIPAPGLVARYRAFDEPAARHGSN